MINNVPFLLLYLSSMACNFARLRNSLSTTTELRYQAIIKRLPRLWLIFCMCHTTAFRTVCRAPGCMNLDFPACPGNALHGKDHSYGSHTARRAGDQMNQVGTEPAIFPFSHLIYHQTANPPILDYSWKVYPGQAGLTSICLGVLFTRPGRPCWTRVSHVRGKTWFSCMCVCTRMVNDSDNVREIKRYPSG
ncbi:hypothetical protein F5883DRAFT_1391 [Diaporthe sp. PMI_573]|nr:hypothetical protein F5883DRAFT_1391 [Diaporthaceae sp. PMI_573]